MRTAALQEPRLWPDGLTEERDESGKLNARGEVQKAFSFLNVRTWQEAMEASAPRRRSFACRRAGSVNTRSLGV
jgi:hypothetical protein